MPVLDVIFLDIFPQLNIFWSNYRMPYMNLPNFTYSVPYCNTSEKLRLAEDLQKDLLWEGKGWHPASCHCENSSSCSQYLYETNSDTFARHDDCAQYKVIQPTIVPNMLRNNVWNF